MNTLRVVQVKVPKHGVIRNIGLGMSLVTAIHGREFDWVSDEEHGQVVEDKVLDTLFGVEFGSPAANITNGIAGSFLATDSRDSCKQLRLFPDAREEICVGEMGDVFEDFEFAKGSSGLCMYAPGFAVSQ